MGLLDGRARRRGHLSQPGLRLAAADNVRWDAVLVNNLSGLALRPNVDLSDSSDPATANYAT